MDPFFLPISLSQLHMRIFLLPPFLLQISHMTQAFQNKYFFFLSALHTFSRWLHSIKRYIILGSCCSMDFPIFPLDRSQTQSNRSEKEFMSSRVSVVNGPVSCFAPVYRWSTLHICMNWDNIFISIHMFSKSKTIA